MHRKKMSLYVAAMVSMSVALFCLQLFVGTVPSASGSPKRRPPPLAKRVATLERQQRDNEMMFKLVDMTLHDVNDKLKVAEQRTRFLRARVRALELRHIESPTPEPLPDNQ